MRAQTSVHQWGVRGFHSVAPRTWEFGSWTKARARRGKLEAGEGLHPAKQDKTHEREMPPVLK